jgi:hypothetical protein
MLNERDRRPYVNEATAMRAEMGEQVFDKAHSEGRAMSVERAIEYALEEVKNA